MTVLAAAAIAANVPEEKYATTLVTPAKLNPTLATLSQEMGSDPKVLWYVYPFHHGCSSTVTAHKTTSNNTIRIWAD
ncbi:MAG: hypothetical protein ACTSUQ_13880 [Candidatus Freyarchaeota archaeon]